jgi:predicted RNA methylase
MSDLITDYETDEERDFIDNKEITEKEKKVLENYDKLKKDIDNLKDMVGKTEARKMNYKGLKNKFESVRKKVLNYFENLNPKRAMKRTREKIREMKAEIRESKALYRQSPDIPKAGSLEYGYYIYLAKYQLVAFLEEYYKNNPDKEPENSKQILKRNKDRLIDYIFDNFKEEELPKDLNFFDKYPRPSNIQGQIEKKAGILKLTDEEAEDLINRQDYSNIYEGKNPLGKFTGNEKIKLLDHQRKFLNGFFLGNLRSAVVYHGVGTGKTFSAVACVKLYLQLYPKGNVIIITPPAVLFNFIDSLIAYGMNPQDRRISYFSFDRFSRNKGISTKDSLIIIDEAHNLRTEVVGIIEEEKDAEGNLKYQAQQITKGKRPANFIIKGAEANKIIMLTATPFVNTPYDIENLIAIGSSRPPLDKETFGKSISGVDFRYDYFKYRISKYDRNFLKGDFPEMREKFVGLVPPKDFKNSIEAIAGKSNAFYSASRQAGLTIDKINYCIDIINKNPTKKFVIYSAYVFQGINKIEEELNKSKIQYGFITGGMNVKTIARFIDGYNNYNNKDYQFDKIRVLLISKAGSEGVNLLETRGIFVIDGVWNEALYEQVVARAVRYRSHKALPENEQYVDVYKVFLCFENELPFLKRLNEGKGFDFQRFLDKFNEMKKEMRKKKNAVNATSLSNDQLLSGKVKGLTQKAVIDIARKSGDFNELEFKKLKKGSKERRDYLEKNLTFGKDKAKFEAQNLLKGMKIPSTDFYMFVLQKVKENKIRQFVEELKDIPMIEKTIEDIPKAKKLLEEIKADKITDEDIIKNLVNALVGNEKEIDTILKKSIKKGVKSVDLLIVKMNLLKELRKEKARARLNQEFFTPSYLVEELVKLSGITNREKFTGLNVLEPSAGWGNICRLVLEVGAKKQLDIKMDAVEYIESNREELKKLVEVIPTAFNLTEQNNFLLFIPSKRYDYVFMNPPFHLQSRMNKIYSRDIFDYDFVKRAYSMLKLNGVLVAITGMKWKENEKIKKFYKSIDAEIKEMKGVEWKGEGVRRGQEINKVDISMIYIKKLVLNSEIDNEILDEGAELFSNFEKEIKVVKPKSLPIPAPQEPKEQKEKPKEKPKETKAEFMRRMKKQIEEGISQGGGFDLKL